MNFRTESGRGATCVVLVLSLLLAPPFCFVGPRSYAQDASPLWGFADLHTHQFANLGFGGVLFQGEPFNSGGPAATEMERALAPCDFNHFRNFIVNPLGIPVPPILLPPIGQPAHGPDGLLDLIGAILDERFHPVGGYPNFNGWPHYTNHTHQQMYHDWLSRAWQGGLRLMVMLALNSEPLCKISNRQHGFGCLDMPAVDRQIQAAKDLEAWIDTLNGGPGRGWYRIAYSGSQARQIIASGKLAVVLGIEVDDLFGCLSRGGCSEEFVRLELSRYYNLGVRHLFPIHLADNAFGGTAIFDDMFNINNLLVSGHLYRVRDCSESGFEFQLGTLSRVADLILGFFNSNPFLLLLRGSINLPTYPHYPHCNSGGLTPLGETLIREMVAKGMIIDIDHMSELTIRRTLEICEETGYPVVSGHSGFVDTCIGENRFERLLIGSQVERIRRLGGLTAPGLMQGEPGGLASSPRIAHTCGKSSQSWAIAYLHAVAEARGGAVAVGSDFNGFAGSHAPRTDGIRCQGQSGGVTYPFLTHGEGILMLRSLAGTRFFDYNVDGFAHIGLYPDFVQDLKSQGLNDDDLAPFFRSAEAYVRMWERIENRSYAPPVVPQASSGFFSSGYDDGGDELIANGLADDNFVVAGPPGLGLGEVNAVVVPDDRFPIGPWMATSARSKWIGLPSAASTGPPGVYTFRADVEIQDGITPARVYLEGGLAADDRIVDVRINGATTGYQSANGFWSLTALPANFGLGLFRSGTNSIEILVENSPPGLNPVGLRVEAALRADESDLAFVFGSPFTATASVPAGGDLTVSDTLFNDGTALGTAQSPSVSYSLQPGGYSLGKRVCPSLTPGGSSSGAAGVRVPPETPPGAYTLVAYAEASPPSIERTIFNNSSQGSVITILPQSTIGFLEDSKFQDAEKTWKGEKECVSFRDALVIGPTDERECWVWAVNPTFPATMTFEFDLEFLGPGGLEVVGRHGGVAFCATTATQRTDPSFSGYELDWIDRWDDRGLRLVRSDGGLLTVLAGGNPLGATEPPRRWRVEVLPDRIRAYGDGILFIDHPEATYRGGHAGFWAHAFKQWILIDNVLFENVPLTASFSIAPSFPVAGAPASFDGTLSLTPLGTKIEAWTWDFGDGETGRGPMADHVYANAGDFNLFLTVTDTRRKQATTARTVHVYEPLVPFADCFGFPGEPPQNWSVASGNWEVGGERSLSVATDPAWTDEAWAWAGASPRPISGDFTAELNLTASFAPGLPEERGMGPPIAGIVLYADRPASTLAEGPQGYLIAWTKTSRFPEPILALFLLRGNRMKMLARPAEWSLEDQDPFNPWRIQVGGSSITLTIRGRTILQASNTLFRGGYVGLFAQNGGALTVDNVAVPPHAAPCSLSLAVEFPKVDPPILRLRGNGAPPANPCPPRSDCACDTVKLDLDGTPLGDFSAGNPFELDLPLPANCTPGTRHTIRARSVSIGKVGPAATVEFTCPAPAIPNGRQLPSDCNGDGRVDLTDALCLLFFLFEGGPTRLPCDDPDLPAGANSAGSFRLLDFDGDGLPTITDPIALLVYLFRGGAPPALGEVCTPIAGCPLNATCR